SWATQYCGHLYRRSAPDGHRQARRRPRHRRAPGADRRPRNDLRVGRGNQVAHRVLPGAAGGSPAHAAAQAIRRDSVERAVSSAIPEFDAPRAAAIRHRALKASLRTDGASSGSLYEAGSHSRRTRSWYAPETTANDAVLGDLTTVRNRSREATRNDGFAKE